ncbi:MAG: glutamine synthetase [Caldilineaceae bacterium SB0670_bin_27]|uniref:Glutamine synthetase n=1 Tax=Caldilineaceae bacterium SB0664_bin_27 TaxID=2605260 RepID=A0A6B0YQJ6_9CHLR|nr:glutamine synthetase [Caldilineaceae bacterium SB0664_bin_27]MYJ78264.1 glutamine synthetase [Caldilineaceae bacterium SB0670_bin_27]
MQSDPRRVSGTLTVEELRSAAEDGAIDTVILAFPDPYGKLMGKRLDASFFLTDAARGTHACDYLFTVDMEMEPVPGYQFSNWESGYGDVHLVPDLGTLRTLSWLDRTALVLCDVQLDPTHEPVSVAPRSILRKQLDRLHAHGYAAMAGSELEYFLYRTSYLDAASNGYRDLAEVGWYREDYHLLQASRTEDLNGAFRRHLAASGVPVESTKGEFGKSQHELNIRYAPVLEMADRHLLLKQAVKEISDQLGCSATFMAKPDAAEAGSSAHLHFSLWTTAGGEPTNAFPGSGDLSGIACSDLFRWFLGGWMHYVPELMVCYAPTVNSYKRFEAGSWAPTALAWSPDNRTAGFRIVGTGHSLRIECRIPGADVNAYLAYAAVIASGLAGIEQQIEPPPPHIGDVYAASDMQMLPATLEEAVTNFAASDLARSAFGADVVEHYAHFFTTEAQAFRNAVTDWERTRYFERI